MSVADVKESLMQPVLYYLTFLAPIAVLIVLLLGVANLVRTPRQPDPVSGRTTTTNLSQQLMRWRVGLQFAAIVILMLSLYLSR